MRTLFIVLAVFSCSSLFTQAGELKQKPGSYFRDVTNSMTSKNLFKVIEVKASEASSSEASLIRLFEQLVRQCFGAETHDCQFVPGSAGKDWPDLLPYLQDAISRDRVAESGGLFKCAVENLEGKALGEYLDCLKAAQFKE